jgi:NAD+ synthase (glutamine-hydrolysing)
VIDGVMVGVSICEDIWYPGGPPTIQAYAGAEVLLNLSSSPFFVGKQAGRERMLATRASDTGSIVAYCNLVGGQDELIFDGNSVVFDGQGDLVARAKAFEEDLLLVDLDIEDVFRTRLHDPRRRWLSVARPPMPIRRRHPSPHGSSRCSHARRRRTGRWCSVSGTTWARTASRRR